MIDDRNEYKDVKNKLQNIIIKGDMNSNICLIQPVFDYDKEQIESELFYIKELTNNQSILFVGIEIEDANQALSPWPAPPVRGEEGFGIGAKQTLFAMEHEIIPYIRESYGNFGEKHTDEFKFILAGYSFAGLFALWAGYKTDVFSGIAAVSPSVWFPDWDRFIEQNQMQASKVYLSLGKKESKTRNPMMKNLEERISMQHDTLCKQIGAENNLFEWNPGNHFAETDKRKAKGIAWIMTQLEKDKSVL